MTPAYRYEWDDCGGYDCMTGAFRILSPEGRVVAEVDLRHHGQEACEHPTPIAAIESASRLAGIIVDALNDWDKKCTTATKETPP